MTGGAGGTAPEAVHAVLPGGVDDTAAPSGGNTYDRRLCDGLAAAGRPVAEITAPGTWPYPDTAARTSLAESLAALPDGALVLADGLVVCGAPEIAVPHARRLRLAVLVHLPLADETGLAPQAAAGLDARERATLRAAAAVITTSRWAARRLADHHGLDRERMYTVEPGTDPALPSARAGGGTRLLCVAAVTPRKGHDLLAGALAGVADLAWTCECAGPLHRAPAYVAELRRALDRCGIADRVRLAGPLAGAELAAAYSRADLLVLPSRAETYGMVAAEALARGIPVLVSDAGALPETVGTLPDGSAPGIVVPADDPQALAAALRGWLTTPAQREHLRTAARRRRSELRPWPAAAADMDAVLQRLQQEQGPGARQPQGPVPIRSAGTAPQPAPVEPDHPDRDLR
ncbi:glycosyltransferase family 4 protein [Streptomonospora sediminis]